MKNARCTEFTVSIIVSFLSQYARVVVTIKRTVVSAVPTTGTVACGLDTVLELK